MRTYGCAVNLKQETRGHHLIQRQDRRAVRAPASRGGRERRRRAGQAPVARSQRLSGHGWRRALAAVLVAGCAGGHAVPAPPPPPVERPASGSAVAQAGLAGPRPAPGLRPPASVAAAFYVAWAQHRRRPRRSPDAYLARCAPLVTAALERQLAASQPATAAWQAMRRARRSASCACGPSPTRQAPRRPPRPWSTCGSTPPA